MGINKSPYRGTRDFFPTQMRIRNYLFNKISQVAESFAYEPYDGPLLEEVELYRAKSGEELINEQIYSFTDRGEREVAIRPEMTPTLARMVSQIHREVSKPIRMYSIPNLMRYEKPQKGRLREFWQFNADIFGAGVLGEIEVLQMCVLLLQSFGADSTHFEIMINDRRFVDFVFKGLIGLPESDIKKLYKLIDAKNKMPEEKFSSEVRKITDDETKAAIFEKFTSLKNVSDIKNFVSNFFDTTSASDLHHYKSEIPISITTHVSPLYKLFEKLDHLGLTEFVKFDPSIVRGLDYYTGTVFEIYDKHPENRRAIAGGGSYANLLQIFDESPLEGVGVGLGEVPLLEFLKIHHLLPDLTKSDIDYLVAYLVEAAEEQAQQLAMKLRKTGHKVELIPFEMKPKKVFSYADKKNVKYICFIGEDELKNNCAKIKNVADKTEQVIDLNDVR